MQEVGVRELGQHASAVLRRVREKRETFTVTYRGKAVATLTPVIEDGEIRARRDAVLERMDRLAKDISKVWPAGVSAVEAVREQRREL